MKTPSVYLSNREAQDYCRRYDIHLLHLDNGITIIGLTRAIPDLARAEMVFNFFNGGSLDEPGKEGTVHLWEHLINPNLRNEADVLDVNLQAVTQATILQEIVGGPANSEVLNFGLWPILSKIRQTLESPLAGFEKPAERIELEKKVLAAEIAQQHAQQGYHVYKNIRHLFLSEQNPSRLDFEGSAESLQKITLADVVKVEKKMSLSKMLVSLMVEGQAEATERLVKQVVELFADWPLAKEALVDKKRLDLVQNREPGEIILRETGLNNGIVTVCLIWPINKGEPFTPYYFAINRYVDFLWQRLFQAMREEGWSYKMNINLFGPGLQHGFVLTQVDLPKKPGLEAFIRDKLVPKVNQVINLKKAEFEQICQIEEIRAKAKPMPYKARLNWMMEGLRYKNQLIDADRIKEVYGQITPRHLSEWQKVLTSFEPIVLAVGDLK